MSIIKTILPLVPVVLLMGACSRSPEQLIADCASATAHRLETGLKVAPVALDVVAESAIETCGDAFKGTQDARSAFGAGRAALAHDQWDASLEWFSKAADAGYRADLTQIGFMSAYMGRGQDIGDVDQAIEAGLAAKKAGAEDAAVMLAEVYSNPQAGRFDFEEAVNNYELATKGGSNIVYANQRLSTLYLTRGQSGQSPNFRRDLMAALRWSVAWAKSDPQNAEAWVQAASVVLLDTYPASEKDAKRIAYDNYRKAAELGHPEAAFQTAYALYFGSGVTKSVSASIPFFQTAAAAGDARAHYVLAHTYWSGNGAEKNAALAEKHALAAVATGHEEATKLYNENIKPLMIALRAMPDKSAQSCMKGEKSQYNATIFEVYNTCTEPMNVLICENYALTDVIGFFQGKDNKSCRIKNVAGGGFVESMYFSEDDAALGWQLISGSKLEWGACFAPLRPRVAQDGTLACEW